jgi:carbon-monoxide dehydrogenase medium subunit
MAEKAPVLREAAMSTGGVQIRNMATIGGNLCNASPAADAAPPLLVLEAEVDIASLKEVRTIPLANLFAGPKMNSLRPGELLTEIRFRVPLTRSGASFHRLGRRRGMTLSLVNAAAYVATDGALCQEARVALGSVAPTPIRVLEVEGMLKGERLSQRLIEEAAVACRRSIAPVDDIRASAEYRREMACVLTKRALNDAWVRARGNLH